MQMKCALLATGKSSDRRLIYANEAVPIEINLASPSLPPSASSEKKDMLMSCFHHSPRGAGGRNGVTMSL